MSYDDWRESGPHEDMPNAQEHACDMGFCGEPWALEVERSNGPRKLRLCEEHADRWLKAEASLDAEIEEMAGRSKPELSAFFALAKVFSDGRTRRRTA